MSWFLKALIESEQGRNEVQTPGQQHVLRKAAEEWHLLEPSPGEGVPVRLLLSCWSSCPLGQWRSHAAGLLGIHSPSLWSFDSESDCLPKHVNEAIGNMRGQ